MRLRRSSSSDTTRTKLLDAAARVIARDGLNGSTTRAIAHEAGVNEVTLFRHFQSKDRLIAAVIGENFGAAAAASQPPLPAPTGDLRQDLLLLARQYEKLLRENLPLVRTMIGEVQHQNNSTNERLVFRGIFLPLKQAMHARVDAARHAGEVRSDVRADVLADLLLAMLFTGVLRRSSPQNKIEYSASHYVDAAIELFLNGAAKTEKVL